MRWISLLFLTGCGLLSGQDEGHDRHNQQASAVVLINLAPETPVFRFDSSAGRLVTAGKVSDWYTRRVADGRIAVEYLSANAHWVWVGSVDSPHFVSHSSLTTEPYPEDPNHWMFASYSLEEFVRDGLPMWAADSRGQCPEYTLDAQGRLVPAPLLLRFGRIYVPVEDRDEEEDYIFLFFATTVGDYVMGPSLQLSSNHCLKQPELLHPRFDFSSPDTSPVDDRSGFINSFIRKMAKMGDANPSEADVGLLRALAGSMYDANHSGQSWFMPYRDLITGLSGYPKNAMDDATFNVLYRNLANALSGQLRGSYVSGSAEDHCFVGTGMSPEEEAAFRQQVHSSLDFDNYFGDIFLETLEDLDEGDENLPEGTEGSLSESELKAIGDSTNAKEAAQSVLAYLTAIHDREFVVIAMPDGEWRFIAGRRSSGEGTSEDEYNDEGDFVGANYRAHTHPYAPCTSVTPVNPGQKCVCLGASAGMELRNGTPTITSGDVAFGYAKDQSYLDIVSPILHGSWEKNYKMLRHTLPPWTSSLRLPIRTSFGIVQAHPRNPY